MKLKFKDENKNKSKFEENEILRMKFQGFKKKKHKNFQDTHFFFKFTIEKLFKLGS